jgi:hypothetical protein
VTSIIEYQYLFYRLSSSEVLIFDNHADFGALEESGGVGRQAAGQRSDRWRGSRYRKNRPQGMATFRRTRSLPSPTVVTIESTRPSFRWNRIVEPLAGMSDFSPAIG